MIETREHRLSAAPAGAADVARAEAAAVWQGGWAVAVVAGAAALLVAVGEIAGATAAALLVGAAPGVLGYLWRPAGGKRLVLIVLWAIAAAVAATLSGGATGPLVAWCLAPLLVGALLGLVPPGALLAVLAVLAAAAMEWAGASRPAQADAGGVVLSAIGLLVLFGGVAGAVVLTVRDVRRRAEALRAEHSWFEEALSALPHLGAALEPNGVPEAVFGAAPQGLAPDWLAKGVVEAASAADRAAVGAALRNALEAGEGEAVFRPAAAPDRTFRLSLRRRGQRGLSAMIHEPPPPQIELPADERVAAAERRAAEAETARADAEAGAAAKSRFLANMSHELRTPLNAIMGFSDIMRARMFGELSPKYGEYAELIHESGRHLTDLINDVLDMSKIEAERYSLTLESFDARDAINASMRLMRLQADEAGIQLRGLMPPEPIAVEADRRALKQIVLNLVSNALKFTPPGGSVTVTARARGGELEMVVADTGAGIAPEDLERLGRPYEQAGDADRRAQGTGLGLSLVKAFAGLHGGAMSIESAQGEGTAVTVRMPVIAGWVAEPTPQPDPVSDAVPVLSADQAAEALLETAPVDGAQVLEAEIEDRAAEMAPLESQPHDALRAEVAPAAESDLEAEMAQEPGAEAAFQVEVAAELRTAPPLRPQPEAANEAGEPPGGGGVVIHLPGARPV